MPYCKQCGFKLPDDASFCPNCGIAVTPESRLELASWGERIVAYLIDIIILAFIMIFIMIFIAPIFLWPWVLIMRFPWNLSILMGFSPSNVVLFLYWTFLEGIYGQSLGKMILKLKVVKADGKPIDIVTAAIESLGKAFLPLIDLLLGLILYPQKQQRLFNHVSNTLVIKA